MKKLPKPVRAIYVSGEAKDLEMQMKFDSNQKCITFLKSLKKNFKNVKIKIEVK